MTARRFGSPRVRLAAAGALAVTLGYQVQGPVGLSAGSVLGLFSFSGFEPSERGYRWSHAHAEVRFHDATPDVPVRVDLDLVAWRPRDFPPPHVTVSLEEQRLLVVPAPGIQTVTLTGAAHGAWRSDLVVSIDSDTFVQPGEDPRAVGVRLHGARLTPSVSSLGIRRPPLEPVVWGALAVLLLCEIALRLGAAPALAFRLAIGACVLGALAWGAARPWAVVVGRPLVAGLVVSLLLLRFRPGPVRWIARAGGHALEALRDGLRTVISPAAAALLLVGAIGLVTAHRGRPRLDIRLASARANPLAQGFGPVAGAEDVRFREARPSAQLDLRGFGGGAPWRIQVTAALADETPRRLVVAQAAGATLALPLGSDWMTGSLEGSATFGWRGGLRLLFPSGAHGSGLRIRRVQVDRGRSWPALSVLAAQLAAPSLLALALATVGLRWLGAWTAGFGLMLVEAASIVADPITSVTFAASLCGIVALALLLSVTMAGLHCMVSASSGREIESLPPIALAASCLGFVAWFAALTFPLYSGGHFGIHSAVAEEIWHGHILEFYLPEGESVMTRQVQWGNIVVPNPFLYHLVIAPLAALPRAWFHWAEKGALALMLTSQVLLAALLAGHIGGRRAAGLAAAMAACFVTSFQLLGLGHMAAVFGTFTSSWALGFAILFFRHLSSRVGTWTLAGLLTAAFLSYLSCLLFTILVIGFAAPMLFKRHRNEALAFAKAGLIAAVLAFGLYYVHWAVPFVTRSIPSLAGSTQSLDFSLAQRLAAEPQKLAYSYGSVLVPLGGLLGLYLFRRADERIILLVWGGLFVAVGGLDLSFNFLRKHHYFVIVPLQVGCGLLLARLESAGRVGRALSLCLLAGAIALGAQAALETAIALP